MLINGTKQPLRIRLEKPRTKPPWRAAPIAVLSWLLMASVALYFVHWATAPRPESDAILDLSTEEGAVIEMWESTVAGPSLTSFFTFTGVEGDRYECRRLP